MPPWAVCTTTGTVSPASRIFASTPSPSRPGITRSRTTASIACASGAVSSATAASPLSTTRGSYPHFCTMFSTRRRCTASSSAIKMVAAMVFPTRYNYLSRIGALSPMPINALLNVAGPPDFLRAPVAHVECDIEDDGEADIGDPAMLLQQVRDEAGGEPHQGDR